MLDAKDDFFTLSADAAHSSGSVFTDNGAGADTGDGRRVLSVNGDAALVGVQIALASGALLTVNADGSYDYDPNGAFDALAAGESGADSFTYTLGGADKTGTDFAASIDLSTLDGATGFKLNDNWGLGGGSVVSDAGDVNGDGIDDVMIGSEERNANGGFDGQGYVVFGSRDAFAASQDTADAFYVTGTWMSGADTGAFGIYMGYYNGSVVSDAGDVNGDCLEDLILGAALGDPDGRLAAQENYVIHGQPAFTPAVDVATVTIAISGANHAPVAQDDARSTDQNTAILLDPLGNDSDPDAGDAPTLTAIDGAAVALGDIVALASGGSLTVTAEGLTFAPLGAYDGLGAGEQAVIALSYTLTDLSGATADAAIAITVHGLDDAPEFTSGPAFAVKEGTLAVGTVAATDVDLSDTLVFAIDAGGDGALFDIDADTGSLSFRAAPDHGAAADIGGDNVYDLTVSAFDGTAAVQQAIAVTVTDVIEGGASGEVLRGGSGDDEIRSGGGPLDQAFGGDGADTFVFENIVGARDIFRVRDFVWGEDTLDFNGETVAKMSQSAISTMMLLDGPDHDIIIIDRVGIARAAIAAGCLAALAAPAGAATSGLTTYSPPEIAATISVFNDPGFFDLYGEGTGALTPAPPPAIDSAACTPIDAGGSTQAAPAIPPFSAGFDRRIHATAFSFRAGAIPPMPGFGRSLLQVHSHCVARS